MSHVDEGALHAYLDGALDELPAADAARIREHLEQCAECTRRLEVERNVRSDAHTMLGLADPAVDIPSLEELRAYVKRTRPDRPVAVRRLRRMGWAASIVVAVGAGWMLRDGQLQPAGPDVTARAGDASARRAASDGLQADREAVESSRSEEEARVLVAEGAPVAPPVSEAEGSQKGRPSSPVEAEPSAVATSEGATGREIAPGAAGAGDAADLTGVEGASGARDAGDTPSVARRAVAPQVAEADAAPRVESLPMDVASTNPAPVDAGTADQRALDSLSDAARPPGETVSAFADIADAGAGDDTADASAERSRAAQLSSMVSALDLSGSGAYRETGNAEPVAGDEPPLAVPGLEVLSVTSLGEGTAAYGVHVVQRLEANNLLDVFHLEPGVDAAILPPVGEGTREVRLETEAGWLVLRGPLQIDELEALMTRISAR